MKKEMSLIIRIIPTIGYAKLPDTVEEEQRRVAAQYVFESEAMKLEEAVKLILLSLIENKIKEV